MKKILTEKQQKELVFMKDWILIVHDYIFKDDEDILEEDKLYIIKAFEIGEIL